MAGFSFELTGRTALVTGASSGLGERFARILAAAGANVVVAARRVDRLERLREEIGGAGGRVLAVPLDVVDEAATVAAYDAAEAAFGTVDTIIANAGMESEQAAVGLPVDDFDRVIATNLRGVFLTVREGARRLIGAGSAEREHGRVVITASITANKPYPGTAAYSASKAGVLQMGKVLAREWARKGVNVNMILPGYIRTEITEHWLDTDYGRGFIGRFPRRRLAEASDLDVPLLFLSSDASQRVTGTAITIDDGQSL